MAERIILLILRGRGPLPVPAKVLTENSKFFHRIIVDLGVGKHDMTDFSADLVIHFIQLLKLQPEVTGISNSNFRELHKMTIVLKVAWFEDVCRKWLLEKITNDIMVRDKLFVFEECLYVLRRWGDSSLMDEFVSFFAVNDNTALIDHYSDNFEKLDVLCLELMLTLGGSNTTVFMEIMLRNLENKQSLHQNTRFLLENLNLPLCLAQNEELYDKMFASILDRQDLTKSDFRMISVLLLEASRESRVMMRTDKSCSSVATAVFDDKKWGDLVKCSGDLADLIQAITQHNVSSVFIVVDMLLHLFVVNPPSNDEIDRLSTTLIKTCLDNYLHKISSQYLCLIKSALKYSPLPQKDRLINLLETIRNERKLSCRQMVVIIPQEKVSRKNNSVVRTYIFKHPGVVCHESGRCGFKLKHCKEKNDWRIVLCTDAADYRGSDVHYHNIVSLDRMYHYGLVSGTTETGHKVEVPARFGWWTKWLPGLKQLTVKEECILYNLTGYHANKHYFLYSMDNTAVTSPSYGR